MFKVLGKFFTELLGKVCAHKYEIIKTGLIQSTTGEKVGTYYELRCPKCGAMKVRNLK